MYYIHSTVDCITEVVKSLVWPGCIRHADGKSTRRILHLKIDCRRKAQIAFMIDLTFKLVSTDFDTPVCVIPS